MRRILLLIAALACTGAAVYLARTVRHPEPLAIGLLVVAAAISCFGLRPEPDRG
jgi:hypothetical protein